jgi:hypothetical protein
MTLNHPGRTQISLGWRPTPAKDCQKQRTSNTLVVTPGTRVPLTASFRLILQVVVRPSGPRPRLAFASTKKLPSKELPLCTTRTNKPSLLSGVPSPGGTAISPSPIGRQPVHKHSLLCLNTCFFHRNHFSCWRLQLISGQVLGAVSSPVPSLWGTVFIALRPSCCTCCSPPSIHLCNLPSVAGAHFVTAQAT